MCFKKPSVFRLAQVGLDYNLTHRPIKNDLAAVKARDLNRAVMNKAKKLHCDQFRRSDLGQPRGKQRRQCHLLLFGGTRALGADPHGDPAEEEEDDNPDGGGHHPQPDVLLVNVPASQHDVPHGRTGQGVGQELGDDPECVGHTLQRPQDSAEE